jgi:hypothetical protein
MSIELTDRRIHQVFVTRNTEYHVRRDRVVAVRDRLSGLWRDTHNALFRRVTAAVQLLGNGSLKVREALPRTGESLLFDGADGAITSPVVAVERPERETVSRYPGRSVAGD